MKKRLIATVATVLMINGAGMYAQEPDSLKSSDVAMDLILKGAVIKTQMPLVKSKDGKLVYSIPKILKESTATNAFDILKEVPGVSGMNDKIELTGARTLRIVLNGKISSMTLEQLTQLLKSMPASRVENIEIMYVAPAKYNFNGAIINVVLNSPNGSANDFMGEAGAEYAQYKYPSKKVYTNLLYGTGGWNIDFLLNMNDSKNYSGEDMYARHNFKGKIIPIEQSQLRTGNTYGGVTRLGMEYLFPDKSRLSGAYYLRMSKGSDEGDAVTAFGEPPVKNYSFMPGNGRSGLHNISLQYERQSGFSAGIDYTYYNEHSELFYKNNDDTQVLTDLYNPSLQRISSVELYANSSSKVGKWVLDYGLSGGYNGSHNKGEYYYNGTGSDYIDDMRQKEASANVYLEIGRSFGPTFSFKAGLKGEYFYAYNSNAGVLWNKYAVYPTISLNYTFNKNHMLQFHVSSDITYPSYWDLSSRKVPLNAYTYAVGNPELMPYRTYTAQLIYILKSKYMAVGFYNYSPDYFTQLQYQKEDELANVFEFVNFNYMQQYGVSLILPFKVGRFWNSKVTLTGVRIHEKNDHFHSIEFNRTGMFGVIQVNNTFKIPSVKAFSVSLNGKFVTSGAVQGLYDLGYMYPVSAAVKYTFAKEQATITLAGEDIFNATLPNKIEINTQGQYSRMYKVGETRCLKLTFSYRFGGYKKKEYKEVDRSRY